MPSIEPILFALKTTYFYKGTKIENLTKEQLLALLKRILDQNVTK